MLLGHGRCLDKGGGGNVAILPTAFSGVPTEGDKIKSGCITRAFSVAQKGAELPLNPCVLGGPQEGGTKMARVKLVENGPSGRSLRAVLNKKKIWIPKDPPAICMASPWALGGSVRPQGARSCTPPHGGFLTVPTCFLRHLITRWATAQTCRGLWTNLLYPHVRSVMCACASKVGAQPGYLGYPYRACPTVVVIAQRGACTHRATLLFVVLIVNWVMLKGHLQSSRGLVLCPLPM